MNEWKPSDGYSDPVVADVTAKLADDLQGNSYPANCFDPDVRVVCLEAALALVKAAYEQAQAEPVAWLVLDKAGSLVHAAAWRESAHEHINDAITEYGIKEAAKWVVRPAFLAAPVAQAEPRKPLTDEQIKEAVRGAGLNFTSPDFKVARAIEAAHGIKENNHD